MIQRLALQYNKAIAYILFFSFYISCVSPLYAAAKMQYPPIGNPERYLSYNNYGPATGPNNAQVLDKGNALIVPPAVATGDNILSLSSPELNAGESADFIGGPSQPEMSAFKSAGTNDMVNLFTGDFSYNIPLLDVGGYPVNIFYNGGITMEQEASWVGLGWNINPGTVSRNMRGVPDDFDGTEKIVQQQNMKPNTTWGGRLGVDVEIVGVKGLSVGLGLGYSHNSYLGPALDVGVKAGYSFKLSDFAASEKNAKGGIDTFGVGSLSIDVSVSADLNSRNGLTINPNISLGSKFNTETLAAGLGWGVSTSYNSRTGVKGFNLYEQQSANYGNAKTAKPFPAARSTSISFAKPSYVPAMRMPISNSSYAGSFQYGGAIFGLEGTLEIEVYKQESRVDNQDREQQKPMVGYIYAHKAAGNPDAIMDYTRFNDKEVTPKTRIISVPQYAYDVFSISGEGTGGSVRAYRNDYGYVRDNRVRSKDKSFSFGADIGVPGQYGANFNTVKTPTTSGDWDQGNHLRNAIQFGEKTKLEEHVYFRNPGETSVLNDNQFNNIGGTDLVRFKLGSSASNPEVLPVLERFDGGGQKLGEQNILATSALAREKRTQVINFLTANEASEIGLDKVVKSYSGANLIAADTLQYDATTRVTGNKKGHHISEINITESDGKRYVYGLPVYNIHQEDYTVTVDGTPDYDKDLVPVTANELNIAVDLNSTNKDGYKLITKTPPYAHSFLLTGLLSPDYVDVTGNGITEDDLGTAVKFNYSKMAADYKWRTPYNATGEIKAHFNDGNMSETRDDKGIVSYGERESWYMHSIESKTMLAVFTLEDRKDAKGVGGLMINRNGSDIANKRLKKIDLYNKADLRKNGITNAKPIKTVWFEYDYSLCANAPDNNGESEVRDGSAVNHNEQKGKLTLKGIYFTYNGQGRLHKNKYIFHYGQSPAYQLNAADRWGNYKSKDQNPQELKNSIHPYALQNNPSTIHSNAAAWNLSKILLPSGGQMEIAYESDDYSYVQDRRATVMMPIAYLGRGTLNSGNKLYEVNDLGGISNNDKVYITVPEPCTSNEEVKEKYLRGINQLAFKLAVNMPKKKEFLTVYANIKSYGYVNGESKIWIQMEPVDGYSPLTLTTLDYLREHLPGQAYDGYSPEGTGWEQFAKALDGLVEGLEGAFKNPLKYLMSKKKAQTIELEESFVRLNAPGMKKYGGGHRVKSVIIKDNWSAMTGQYTSTYGQQYDYTTTEIVNGEAKRISSGVASYEPSVGGEENPFQEILQIKNRLPLGPANYEAIEMPVVDAFFQAPVVGYSKVTVSSVKTGTPAVNHNKKSRSGTGKQVTEFFTAKDFPVSWDYTRIDPGSDKQEHIPSSFAFFKKYAFDSRAISQGFKVELNDMHGKIKSQSSYAENDQNTRLNYTEYRYRNTGTKGLNEKFDFVHQQLGGEIKQGNMGVDIELMTDTREFTVKSKSTSLQAQLDWFPLAFIQIWLPFIWPTLSSSENNYRAVTTTKVINYHSIVDSIITIDKGSMVSTKNLVYDAETGSTILSRTNNEFDQPVYQTSYPAYWAYSGMGPAYRNIDGRFISINFLDGKLSGLTENEIKTFFESGDEIYIESGVDATACEGIKLSPGSIKKIWAIDKNKNISSLTNPAPDFIFIDEKGIPYTRNNVKMRIVRSGKRNMLTAPLHSFTSLSTPDSLVGGVRKLIFESTKNKNVLSASALEYKEKWQIDEGLLERYSTIIHPYPVCSTQVVQDCNGFLEQEVNPYRKGLIGTFRNHRSILFYGERTQGQGSLTIDTRIGTDGVLKDFLPYWSFNGYHNMIATTDPKWVWNNEVTRLNARGLELETRDALGIYTSAQYGYSKSLPLAITNNSKLNENFFEGFEDFGYSDKLSYTPDLNCPKPHINLYDLPDSDIVTAWNEGFNAHTGSKVLKVVSDASKQIPFASAVPTTYPMAFSSTSNSVLTGGAQNYYGVIPDDIGSISTPVPTNTSTVGVNDYMAVGIGYATKYSIRFYLKANSTGSYLFESFVAENGGNYDLKIYQVADISIDPLLVYSYSQEAGTGPPSIHTQTLNSFYLSLCQGEFYYVEMDYYPHSAFINYPFYWPAGSIQYWAGITYNYTFSEYEFVHKPTGTCVFTKPIEGVESFFNPLFSLPANKKMLFSAWVRETNPQVSTYSNSEIELEFENGSTQTITIQPAGPIIEGWQKIEGSFQAPAGTNSVNVKFVNKSASPVYFDDIRIHPHEANMKSYIYDPVNLRLVAELDANNYATFYEYDEEGGLIRTKAETYEGIKTIKETRSANQKQVTTIQ